MKVVTKRMTLYPLTNEQMQDKIDAEPDEGMKIAFNEMLTGCKENPE